MLPESAPRKHNFPAPHAGLRSGAAITRFTIRRALAHVRWTFGVPIAELKADVLVLVRALVGVSAALRLLNRGQNVVLIDRHDAAGGKPATAIAG